MSDFSYPIIIAEGLDVNFYTSLDAALLQLEAIDVDNNEYVAYDAKGNKLNLKAENNMISIELKYESSEEELITLLNDFLRAINKNVLGDEDLDTLLNYCKKYFINEN